MRFNRSLRQSMKRYTGRGQRAALWPAALGGTAWLAGAGLCAAWMLHGGGAVRPLASFAVWATGVSFLLLRAIARTSNAPPTMREMVKALQYGGYSALLLALATLFCEYWPVTVSMAFLFAICRGFNESDDTAAYV